MVLLTLLAGVPLQLPPQWPAGMHAIQHGPLRVLITDCEEHGADGQWKHVSVSCQDRLPTYEELGEIRELYFDPAATVMQVMPPASEWVNQHQFCLHLWQRLDADVLPHGLYRTVGVRGGLPLDEFERALSRRGYDAAAMLHNLLRSRGRLTAKDAADELGYLFDGTAVECEAAVAQQLHALERVAPHVRLGLDLRTYQYTGPK